MFVAIKIGVFLSKVHTRWHANKTETFAHLCPCQCSDKKNNNIHFARNKHFIDHGQFFSFKINKSQYFTAFVGCSRALKSIRLLFYDDYEFIECNHIYIKTNCIIDLYIHIFSLNNTYLLPTTVVVVVTLFFFI